MRQVVLDTETTGLEVEKGHRVIEIGCVELINRRRTQNTFHHYVQPDREIDPAAEEVHGISQDMLADKPRFVDIAADLLAYISGAELVIHNADFDVGFLNQELRIADIGAPNVEDCCAVIDSLRLAREIHPGQRNSLDALCKRYTVDNSGRDLHGALLDAQLLADVYLAMTGGQGSLSLEQSAQAVNSGIERPQSIDRQGLQLTVVKATTAESQAHERQLDLIDQASSSGVIWRKADA